MQTIPTARVDFRSRDTRCAAWLTLPPGQGPHPAIVLVHGLGATHDMMLGQYEQHFAAAGIATMAFDYRNTGASDGAPRQHISSREQRHDVASALTHLKARPEIDKARVGAVGHQPRCHERDQDGGDPRRRGGRGGAVPDRARPRRRAKAGPGGVATHRARDRAGRAATGNPPRPQVCADRRTAGKPRDGHRPWCASRLELHRAAGRPVRQPDRGRRCRCDGDRRRRFSTPATSRVRCWCAYATAKP